MHFDPRDYDSRDRDGRDIGDPRDAFMRDLDLPRGEDREIVRDRDRRYTLRGSETRTLSTIDSSANPRPRSIGRAGRLRRRASYWQCR
jgi:hypothetical protein